MKSLDSGIIRHYNQRDIGPSGLFCLYRVYVYCVPIHRRAHALGQFPWAIAAGPGNDAENR